jgi:rubrerythrin
MDEKTKELFKMFEIGVENERSAQEFYEDLIKKSTSQLEKEIFGNFLKEEQKHEQKLMQMYAEMKEKYGLK